MDILRTPFQIDMPDWTIYRHALTGDYFSRVMKHLLPLCSKNASRSSVCVWLTNGTRLDYVNDISLEELSQEATILIRELCQKINIITGVSADYVLIHLYQDGQSSIAWHSDKEAFQSPVASLSLGATRKFRFREMTMKSNAREYALADGDVVLMKTGCQQRWQHTVPVEARVRSARINITFRIKE